MPFPTVEQNVRLNTDAPAQAASAFFNNFNERFKQGRIEKALRKVQTGDAEAMQELYALAPEVAMRVQDQLRQQAEAQRERDATAQANAYYAKTNPDAAPFLAAGGRAKDFAALDYTGARTEGAATRAQASQLKTRFMAWDKTYSLIANGKPNDPVWGKWAKEQARNWLEVAGEDTSGIDHLPDAMTPEQLAQLGQASLSYKDRLAAEARSRGLDISQGRLDESVRHNGVAEGQGQQRIDETGRHNEVTEGQGQARVEQGAARVEQGQARVGQGDRRLTESERHNRATEQSRRGRSGRGGLPKPKTRADFDRLPKGARFLDPNGVERVKP